MLKFEDWGLLDYEEALNRQLQKVEEVSKSQSEDFGFLIFCSHPAVVTLGRKTQPGDLCGWQGPTKEISRGGRATYHGPSQLVVYPIFKIRDIGQYLRDFENAILHVLENYGVKAVGKTLQKKPEVSEETEETGVWVGRQKIASLGIGVKKWVTYHGAAINLDHDPEAFQGLKPCGFTSDTMVSLEKILNRKIDRQQFSESLKTHLLEIL
ncbi:MAG: lipoyl(octanoyl) transferase LipB [Pseudobdellovibrionaceae bacterium]